MRDRRRGQLPPPCPSLFYDRGRQSVTIVVDLQHRSEGFGRYRVGNYAFPWESEDQIWSRGSAITPFFPCAHFAIRLLRQCEYFPSLSPKVKR